MSELNPITITQVIDSIKWDKKGLIPVIAQSEKNNKVLMLAWTNKTALLQTIKTNLATYYSRSRKKIWVKGEESGNYQKITKICLDCDLDSVLFIVNQTNDIACHTGKKSCFFYYLTNDKKYFKIH